MSDCDACERFVEARNDAEMMLATVKSLRRRLDECASQNGYMQLALMTIADNEIDMETARKVAEDGLGNRRLNIGGPQ